jgi:hypothetical protein
VARGISTAIALAVSIAAVGDSARNRRPGARGVTGAFLIPAEVRVVAEKSSLAGGWGPSLLAALGSDSPFAEAASKLGPYAEQNEWRIS